MRKAPEDVKLSDFRRISVRGTSGCGKTHLARRIATALGIPHIDMDAINHSPGWVETPKEKAEPVVAEAVAQEAWVNDGNYGKWKHLTLPRTQLAIFLDFPFPLVLWRGVARTFRRCWSKEEIWPGCRETWGRSFFSRESLIWWLVTTFRRRRRQIAQYETDPDWSHVTMVVFRSHRELENWLAKNGVPVDVPN